MVAAVVVAVGACGGPQGGVDRRRAAASGVGDVTVRGEVAAVVGPRVFQLGQPAGGPVLVVVVPPARGDVVPGWRVEVTGVPEEFRVAALRSRFDLALEGEQYEALEGTRSLLVRKISVLPDVPDPSTPNEGPVGGPPDQAL